MKPSVQLLGKPAVRIDGDVIEPVASKSTALLMYAAYVADWVPREDLLYLLWPDMRESRARRNLRQLLYEVGKLHWASTLEREPYRVRWSVDSDLGRLRAAMQEGVPRSVFDAYAGPLLEGFRPGVAPEFDTWLEFERDTLHREWRAAGHQEVERLRMNGRSAEAADLLARILARDPLDEPSLRMQMRALVEAERHAEALLAFRTFEDRLERELGLEPDPETSRLAESIQGLQGREVVVAGSPAAPRPRLPVDTTDFVGRAAELTKLAEAVTARDVRFLSLVAAGGMGKTRLAIALAQRLHDTFEDGAAFVSLADLEQPSQIPGAIVDALGLRPVANASARAQLLGHLAPRVMLLVLDNLEHLKGDLSLLPEIRERAPGVRLITTSRERLEVADEWVFDVGGLSLPERGDGPALRAAASSATGTDDSGIKRSDAVDLFLRTAARTQGSLETGGLDLRVVEQICRRVRGMPLALVMAAGWLRVLSPEEVLAELGDASRGLDILTQPSSTDDRHASVRDVLDTTWDRLRPREREAWAKLAVTSGSFDRRAAEAITGAGPPLLLALVNKAVVTRSGDRFDLHPLLRSYGRERAVDHEVAEEARRALAEHYLPAFSDMAHRFRGPEQLQALRAAALDIPNVRAAWNAATGLGRSDLIAPAAFDLVLYHQITGQLHAFVHQIDATVAAWIVDVDRDRANLETAKAVSRLLPWAREQAGAFPERLAKALDLATRIGDIEGQAELYLRMVGRGGSRVREHAAAARTRFEQLGHEHGIARVDQELGLSLVLEGFYQEGYETLRRASDRANRIGDARLEMAALDGMIPAHILTGEFDRADEMVWNVRDATRELGIWANEMEMLSSLQWLEMERGDYEAAERYQDERFALYERTGIDPTTNYLFLRSGLRYKERRYDEANELAKRLYDGWDEGWGAVSGILVRLLLGRIALRESTIAEARVYLREAAGFTCSIASPRFLLNVAVATAELLWREGDVRLAAEILAFAEADPATEIGVKAEIDDLKRRGLEPSPTGTGRNRDWLWSILRETYPDDPG